TGDSGRRPVLTARPSGSSAATPMRPAAPIITSSAPALFKPGPAVGDTEDAAAATRREGSVQMALAARATLSAARANPWASLAAARAAVARSRRHARTGRQATGRAPCSRALAAKTTPDANRAAAAASPAAADRKTPSVRRTA